MYVRCSSGCIQDHLNVYNNSIFKEVNEKLYFLVGDLTSFILSFC